MNLLDLARQIATPDQAARRQAIMAHLPVFVHKRQRFNDDGKDYYPENIMVPPQRDEPFIVLGAHYDSVAGSSGANDNAASVAILLHLLKANYAFNTPLEYAFFDLEEQGVVGSRAYLSSSPDKRRIKAMINLDICGVGDTLLIAAGQHAIGTPYHMAAQKAIEDASFPAQLIPLMPPSDDVSFDQYRIPSLSICMVPAADVPLMPAFAAAMHSHNANAQIPSIVDTMHNRPNDNVEVLQESAMWHVTHFLLSLIGHIKAMTQA